MHGRGNILLARDETPDKNHTMSFTLQGNRMCTRTFGLNVSIIDFTLSRINTGASFNFLVQNTLCLYNMGPSFSFLHCIAPLCNMKSRYGIRFLELCNFFSEIAKSVTYFIFVTCDNYATISATRKPNCYN